MGALKGKRLTQEHKRKISAANKGRKGYCSEETRRKISRALQGRTISRESAERISLTLINKHKKGDVGLIRLYKKYKSKKHSFDLTLEHFKKLTSQNCQYCGCAPKQKTGSRSAHSIYIYNGLDRINNSKGYSQKNVVPCCGTCNKMKLNYSREEFKNHIIKIYKRLNLW